jgi:hypothetical protein
LSNSVSVTVRIDKTPPNPPTANVTPAPNLAGWNNSTPVTVTFTDNGDAGTVQSGVATCTGPTTLSDETAGTVVSGTCTDVAGNISVATSVTVKIDKTAPVITITIPPDGGVYLLNQVVLADWEATDALSGVATTTATKEPGEAIDTATVGSKTFEVTATDKAGNEASLTVNYKVEYKFGGFLPPVVIEGKGLGLFKLGSTIPVKFQLFDAAGEPVSTAVAMIYLLKTSDGVTGTEVEGASTSAATTGNLFRYDPTGQLYIFNLATKPLSVGTWQIRVHLNDDTDHTVEIGIKK